MVYDFFEWATFFFIYCFLGWCIESTIVSIERRKLINRGFLRMPLLPIYGSSALVLLMIILPFKNNILIVYFFGMLIATVLEYIVGAIMESIFRIKYWDYSNDKFNYKGRICVLSSLFWGVLCVLLIDVVHDYIAYYVSFLNVYFMKFSVIILSIGVCIDTIKCSKNTFDLNKVLEKMSALKNETENVHREINLLLEKACRDFDNYSEDNEIKEFVLSTKQRLSALKEKLEKLVEYRKKEILNIESSKRRLINRNPSASSSIFNECLREIRYKVLINHNYNFHSVIDKITLFQSKISEFIHRK